jgi:hypothetical protein
MLQINSLEMYKAGFVSIGFSKKEGEDYDETLYPVYFYQRTSSRYVDQASVRDKLGVVQKKFSPVVRSDVFPSRGK